MGYRFDGLLSAFEKETSSQIAVAVYPRWDSLKIAALFAVFFVAIEVLVAYGGAFGGAGGLIRW